MTLTDLLRSYATVPDFYGMDITDVNQANGYGDRPIQIAATTGVVEEMELLFAAGARLNERGEHGATPLHCAVEQGHFEAVEWLLKHGADTTIIDDDKITPKELAAILGEHAIERLFDE